MSWRRVRAQDVKVGDIIKVAGKARRVTRFEPYRHPTIDTPARIAMWDGDYGVEEGMTLFRNDTVEVS